VLLKNHTHYINESADADEKKQVELLVDIVYSIHSNKPRSMGWSKVKYIKETLEIMNHFDYTIKDSI